ncbi:hypothetical protein LWI28_013033 [Acer negundo]|uniref:WAT1-related protein n=1 Tax=Acer negundo TaxID=4023 RepID=A0AAD5IMV3_ACENE|nr:hypothetical protein LWI28_013033 [Acer negundo]KAK4840839.1 hypothetical protein QYF36_019462 [Acer negundo]
MAEAGSAPAMVPERAKLHIAMMTFQFGYAVNHVVMRAALNLGVSKLVFPLYRNIVALIALAPFAYFLEKKDRPAITCSFLLQFFLLGLVGITLNQGTYIFGLDNTSPTFASAVENAVPAVTFILAALLRIEQVQLTRKDGIAKVLGTFVSVTGASVITLYKGPIIYSPNPPSQQSHLSTLGDAEGKNWTLGCICLIGHCLFCVMQFSAIAAYFERDSRAWQVHSSWELLTILYSGLVGSAMAFAIQIWVIDRGGPVFVSAYLPVQTMLVAVMATIALGEEFYLGGIIGALLIISGLYLVVLGKNEESKYSAAISSVSKENKCAEGPGKASLVQPLLPTIGEC